MWLALQFPHLGLEVFTATQPEAPPTVLVSEQRVVVRNRAAATAGIAPGSTLATARSICAELRHHQRDAAAELDRLDRLAEALYRFSPLVSLEPPDALVLEVGGSRKLHADLAELAAQACAVSRSLGHAPRQRLAQTPTAALLLARSGVEAIADVPLTRAGLPESTVERFANMGLHRLGPLLALPEIELGQRFGSELVDFLERLSGRAPDPRKPIRLACEFRRQLHLLEPVPDKEALQQPMGQLLAELEHWLIARQLGAEALRWRFAATSSLLTESSERREQTVHVQFGRGQQRQQAFFDITRLKLEAIELPDDIITVGLEACRLQPLVAANGQLFRGISGGGGGNDGDDAELGELVDQLRARLGEQSCCGIEPRAEHLPEAAWRNHATARSSGERPGAAVRTTGASGASRRPPDWPDTLPPDTLRAPRPFWLFDPPQPTERAALILLRGPERLHTAWWQEGVLRDYYVARHRSGARCWAFVDDRDRWFLHGYF